MNPVCEHEQIVLLVDTVDTHRTSIERVLSSPVSMGVRVSVARDGADALRCVEEGVDLIIIGASLPDMTPVDLLGALKRDSRSAHVPVLFLSRFTGHRRREWDDTADSVLSMPVNPRIFRSTVRTLLRIANVEARLRVTEDTAQRANRAKRDFLDVMSHELRTPLNAIGGYVDLLLMGIHGSITDAQHSDLQRIRRSQMHLLGLINDVLNLTRVEAGHVNFHLTDVPIDEAIHAASALMDIEMQARQLRYVYESCARVTMVHTDSDKLQQILVNLFTNAIKFTPSGGQITVRCDTDASDVTVRISDTGIGIAQDKLDDIFEPFVQVNRLRTSDHEGIGLGLAISRDLARGMGGDLTVESKAGAGSVFTLRLPKVLGPAESTIGRPKAGRR